jgi:hypothetical protein
VIFISKIGEGRETSSTTDSGTASGIGVKIELNKRESSPVLASLESESESESMYI